MKNLLIVIIVILAMVGGFVGWLFARDSGGVPILAYHRINNIDKDRLTLAVDDFDAQMKFLVDNGYNFITPDELLDAWGDTPPDPIATVNDQPAQNEGTTTTEATNKPTLPEKSIIITFDNGYADFYKNVYPILQKYKIKATLLVITDYINLYPDYLTWAQVRELQSSGLVDVESHTLSNFDLTDSRLSSYEIRNQLYSSKQAIEWYLKKPAKFVAYPGGLYTKEVEDLTRDVGYRAAFTIDYGVSKQEFPHFVMPRIPIFGNTSYPLLRFKMRVIGSPIVAPLTRFKNRLISDGNEAVADFIWIP
jgi:peptidoglycan/xylan/chitin deacetylase (PgdA/CDA1 family)